MLDPDPLYVEGYAYLPIAPHCEDVRRWRTVCPRGAYPMTLDEAFALGIAFGAVAMYGVERTVIPWVSRIWASRHRAHEWR